jgi:opacity protein-like surface antigen
MKKIILSAIAVCAFGFANAQDMKFGAKGGVDMVSSKVSYGGTDTTVSTTGFFIGGFADFEISDGLVFEPGLNYHTASKETYKFNYLSLPLLIKYSVSDKINLVGGPSLYYNMEKVETDKSTFNLDLGASYNITDELFVEPRYALGLTGEAKVNHFLIGIGYKF